VTDKKRTVVCSSLPVVLARKNAVCAKNPVPNS